jgi:hypothetical protein
MKFQAFIVPGGAKAPLAFAPGVAVRATMEMKMQKSQKTAAQFDRDADELIGVIIDIEKSLEKIQFVWPIHAKMTIDEMIDTLFIVEQSELWLSMWRDNGSDIDDDLFVEYNSTVSLCAGKFRLQRVKLIDLINKEIYSYVADSAEAGELIKAAEADETMTTKETDMLRLLLRLRDTYSEWKKEIAQRGPAVEL